MVFFMSLKQIFHSSYSFMIFKPDACLVKDRSKDIYDNFSRTSTNFSLR